MRSGTVFSFALVALSSTALAGPIGFRSLSQNGNCTISLTTGPATNSKRQVVPEMVDGILRYAPNADKAVTAAASASTDVFRYVPFVEDAAAAPDVLRYVPFVEDAVPAGLSASDTKATDSKGTAQTNGAANSTEPALETEKEKSFNFVNASVNEDLSAAEETGNFTGLSATGNASESAELAEAVADFKGLNVAGKAILLAAENEDFAAKVAKLNATAAAHSTAKGTKKGSIFAALDGKMGGQADAF